MLKGYDEAAAAWKKSTGGWFFHSASKFKTRGQPVFQITRGGSKTQASTLTTLNRPFLHTTVSSLHRAEAYPFQMYVRRALGRRVLEMQSAFTCSYVLECATMLELCTDFLYANDQAH